MNWQKTQSPWLKILAVFGADEPMSSVSAQKQSPWVETVSPRAHEFRHNPKKGPQKTPKFMGSLPHDRAHITCWLGSGCRPCYIALTTQEQLHFFRCDLSYIAILQPILQFGCDQTMAKVSWIFVKQLWKVTKNLCRALPTPPHFDKIQKISYFFSWNFP